MWASTWSLAEWIGFSARFASGRGHGNQTARPFQQVRVRPAANLQRLEEVIVLLTLQPAGAEKRARRAASGGSRQKHRRDCRGDSMMNDAFDLRLAETQH